MKLFNKFFVLIVLMIAVIFTGCSGLFRTLDNANNQDLVSVNDTEYQENNIDEISIDVSSTDINVISEDREDIKIELSGEKSSNIEHELKVELINNTLDIKIIFPNKINFGRIDLKLDIYVPEDYQGNIKVDASSADVVIGNLDLKKLDIELSSGDTNISNMNLAELKVDVSSGDTTIADINTKEFNFDSSSGDLTGDGLKTESFVYNSTSGSILLKRFEGDISGDSSSAEIAITYEHFDNDIDIDSTSGDVLLDLPADAEFYLSAEASAGDIECDFPVLVKGKKEEDKLKGIVVSDNNTILIETSSGDIVIK